uniref:Uncharacterized protein n=1 Tax=Plectus sambesii TaxID=2011161 RepID=A0A914XPX4_9BILA
MDPNFSSGFYRTQIGLNKPVLRHYIDAANNIDYNLKKDDPDIQRTAQERIATLLGDVTKITNCVGRLQGHIDKWVTFISKFPLDEKQRENERELFKKVVTAEDGVQPLINEA